ncbi:MAG: c-type cytochrome, partial [Planctomycetes bacterium]|nr:c-type cytochrome [Planctomycetota bacterium]
ADAYAQHCALCHGATGNGDGPGAHWLTPAPRDFTLGLFALASTQNGVPTDEDLAETIRRGMPGSAMPPFEWMRADELEEMAQYVRHLAIEGLSVSLRESAAMDGVELNPDEAHGLASMRLTPGDPIDPVEDMPMDEATLQLGRTLYLEHCAACHGADGKGRKPVPGWTDTHEIWTVRNFTAGVMKGGATRQELHWRAVAGIPSSGMPPTRFDDPSHAAALISYVEHLIPAGADDRLRQHRTPIAVARVRGPVPDTADADEWRDAHEVDLTLAPLSWSDDAITAAKVAALHDGDSIAIRVRWKDATRDDRMLGSSERGDGVAVQFSAGSRPAVFGMGSAEHPVNIWHWKAFRFRDVAGITDLQNQPPHGHLADVPLYQPAPGIAEPATGADSLRSRGFETLPQNRDELRVIAAPRYRDGEWSVVFRRAMHARLSTEIDLRPGSTVQVGVAIWNGSAPRERDQKATTIWHDLVLDR